MPNGDGGPIAHRDAPSVAASRARYVVVRDRAALETTAAAHGRPCRPFPSPLRVHDSNLTRRASDASRADDLQCRVQARRSFGRGSRPAGGDGQCQGAVHDDRGETGQTRKTSARGQRSDLPLFKHGPVYTGDPCHDGLESVAQGGGEPGTRRESPRNLRSGGVGARRCSGGGRRRDRGWSGPPSAWPVRGRRAAQPSERLDGSARVHHRGHQDVAAMAW